MNKENFVRSESWSEFKKLVDFDNQPSGFRIFRVKYFDEDGNSCGSEFATDDSERDDMTAVADGYLCESSWISKK